MIVLKGKNEPLRLCEMRKTRMSDEKEGEIVMQMEARDGERSDGFNQNRSYKRLKRHFVIWYKYQVITGKYWSA